MVLVNVPGGLEEINVPGIGAEVVKKVVVEHGAEVRLGRVNGDEVAFGLVTDQGHGGWTEVHEVLNERCGRRRRSRRSSSSSCRNPVGTGVAKESTRWQIVIVVVLL